MQHHWDKRFADTNPEALTWFQPEAARSLALIEDHAGGSARSLIDVGAGNSRLVDGLLARDWRDITLVDLSSVALAQTRARLGAAARDVSFIAADLTAWTPARCWDVWHDRAVFHFMVTKAAQSAYLDALRAGTRAGATVVMATFSPDGPSKCSGLPVQQYSAATLAARLGNTFSLLHDEPYDHVTPKGGVQKFTLAVFRRRGGENAPLSAP